MLKNMRLGVKLAVGITSIALLVVVAMTSITYYSTCSNLIEDGKASALSTVKSMQVALKALYQTTQGQVNSDMEIMKTQMADMGAASLDRNATLSLEITNQITKETQTVTIPRLLFGTRAMNNDEAFVDHIQELAGGGTVTIFQVLEEPQALLRVSTNVFKLDGTRAVGTYIPSDSPVYQTVMAGDTFRGKAFVVNAWYSTAYFPVQDASGRIISVIYVGRKILNDQAREILDEAQLFGNGYACVFNDQGVMVHHPQADLVGKSFADLGLDPEPFLAARDQVLEYAWNGQDKITAITILDPDLGWRIALNLTADELLHDMDRKILFNSLISTAIVLVLLVVFIWLFTRSITLPMRRLRVAAEATAEGDLEALTQVEQRGDEFGALHKVLTHMVDRLKKMIQEADTVSKQCQAESDNAQQAMREAEEARTAAAKAATLAQRQAAQTLEGVVKSITQTGEALTSVLDDSSRNAHNQRDRAQETVTAMNQMNATVLEVAGNASRAAEGSEQAREQAKQGETIVLKVNEAMDNVNQRTQDMRQGLHALGEHAQGIGRIMNVISDIADQTNLLALNAAIEAARAGDAGRGFAVVADEVRKLAEKTMQATKEVGDAVQRIQEGTSTSAADMDSVSEVVVRATEMAGQAGNALETIVGTVEATTDQVRSIAAAAEEQSAASEQINRAVEDINELAEATDQAIERAHQDMAGLMGETRTLRDLMDTLAAGDSEEG